MEAGQTKKRRPWLIPYHDKIPNLVHDVFDATDAKWSWKEKGIIAGIFKNNFKNQTMMAVQETTDVSFRLFRLSILHALFIR